MPPKHEPWPKCHMCEGSGLDYGETCLVCGGTGRDPDCCEQCEEPHVGCNEDGEWLCEDCLFEEEVERNSGQFGVGA